MEETLKLSIIIPVYKVELFLEKCIESIRNQTYRNLEIILVDDGSPDNSGKICDEYAKCDSRIKVIHKKNGGVSSARNTGLSVSQGDYICFIDGDDWIETNTLETCLKEILRNKAEMCLFNYEEVYKDGKSIVRDSIPGSKSFFQDLNNIDTLYKYMNWTAIWNFLIKASLVKNIRFDESLWIGEDTVFKFQIYKHLKRFCYQREPLYHYRIRPESCTGLLHYDLPEIIYKRYQMMLGIIQKGGYPENAQEVINSIELIRGMPAVIELAFNGKISFKCNYKIIEHYINTAYFKNAIQNHNKDLEGNFIKAILIFGKPSRLAITLMYNIHKIKQKIIPTYRGWAIKEDK